jgi:Cu(I)/Ag(I) efflux system membrane fusion protein
MVTAQQDLIYLKTHSAQESGLINATTQKLLLMGMTTAQVNQLIKTGKVFYSLPVFSPYDGHVHDVAHSQMSGSAEVSEKPSFGNNLPLSIREGMYVEKGQNIFNVVDPHKLWAIIKVDRSAVSALKLKQPVNITLPDQPEISINGSVNFIEPVLQDGDKTTSIRVYIDNMDHALKVNSLVKATIQTGVTSGLWIPRSALIDLGNTKVVWLKEGSRYKVRRVITGAVNNTVIEITKGLSATDSIASNAQYLTDSESFIKTNNDEK